MKLKQSLVISFFVATIVPEDDGYQSAVVNFRFIANDVWTTDEAVKGISGS